MSTALVSVAELVIEIPGLPEPMPAVVDGRDPESVARWHDWGRSVLQHRADREAACRDSAEERKIERAMCRASRAYWLATWGWIYEPRPDKPAVPWTQAGQTDLPWIPFPRQIDLFAAIDTCMAVPYGPAASLLVSKSREAGVSWCLCADDLWRWLFTPGYQSRLMSRVEDLVDDPGNPDSLFWKLDFLLANLPPWMLPRGFRRDRHRTKLKLVNPETGAALIGESTGANTGHGGRSARRDYDECTKIPNFREKWDAGAFATNHQVGVSTEGFEEGPDFYNLQHGKDGGEPPVVFPFEWWHVPWHTWEWYRAKQGELSTAAFACQVLRDPFAGLDETAVYPAARDVRFADLQWEPSWSHAVSIDDGYDDDSAILVWQEDARTGEVHLLDAWAGSHRTIRFLGTILTGQPLSEFSHLYGHADREVMAFMATYRPAIQGHVYGDRHGDQRNQVTGTSPFEELRKPPFHVEVISTTASLTLIDRKEAFAAMLKQVVANDTPRVRNAVAMWQRHRYPKRRDGSQATSELREPVHDETSHLTTAAEYYAAMRTLHTMKPRTKGERHTAHVKTRNTVDRRRRPEGALLPIGAR